MTQPFTSPTSVADSGRVRIGAGMRRGGAAVLPAAVTAPSIEARRVPGLGETGPVASGTAALAAPEQVADAGLVRIGAGMRRGAKAAVAPRQVA